MDMNKIKMGLNSLIENDKKHIRIYDKHFEEYDKAKANNVSLYFNINNKNFKVIDHVVIENTNNISNASFYLKVLNQINLFEDNDCVCWVIDHLEYLRNRIYSIHENKNNIHVYKFKIGQPNSSDIILNV